MDVKLGIGRATGMFYHAPAGTALPASPTEQIPATWKNVGDITSDGILFSNSKDSTKLKNWANKIKRTAMNDHSETVKGSVMDTTLEALKTVLGESNVVKSNNTVTASLSNGDFPPPEAFLFVMKDGDDIMMLGCTQGQIIEMDDVTFAPGSAITWSPTIEGQEDGWKFIYEDATV